MCPHILHYWLSVIKKRLGNPDNDGKNDSDKNVRFLLKYRIGKQYVIAIIAKILSSADGPGAKNWLADKIISVASEYDNDVAEKLIDEIKKLAVWIAFVTPKVLEKPESSDDNSEKTLPQLHTREMYYLRDRLRKVNRLGNFYIEREGWCKFVGSQEDPFLTNLKTILKVEKQNDTTS